MTSPTVPFPPPLKCSPPPELPQLSECEQELLDCLWRADGRLIHSEILVDMMYDNLRKEPPEHGVAVLRVLILRLRKATPYEIVNVRGRGYRLVMT